MQPPREDTLNNFELLWKPHVEAKNTALRMTGFKSWIGVKRIENASTQGVHYLEDIRRIESVEGLHDTYSYSGRQLDFEMYLYFTEETAICLMLSIVAVLAVVLIITSDITVTLLVAMCVVVTDLFLGGLIYYWGLTLNQIVVLNVVLAIGTSVDYSTHIAYAYLLIEVPNQDGEYDSK